MLSSDKERDVKGEQTGNDMSAADNAVCVDLARIQRPSLPGDFVSRNDLLDELDANRDKALIIVCAGAGFGKSTLVSGWLERSQLQYAWVALNEDYDDPRMFLAHLIASVQNTVHDFGESLQPLLQTEPLPPIGYLATELKNEFSRYNLVLVLDDLHLISNEDVFKIINLLLNPPLEHLQLCIISRIAPALRLTKLRLENEVIEIGVEKLRMTPAEMDYFLDASSVVHIKQPVRALIRERSEGWVAGLRLFKLQLALGKSDGLLNMDGPVGSLFEDYFLEEILSGFDDICLDTLIAMSVPESFTPGLAEAVVGSTAEDCRADKLIKTLVDENLFVIVIDADKRWYRFHHLLYDLLHKELNIRFTKEQQAGIHKRAAVWYGGQGMLSEALAHAKKADDDELLATLVDDNFYGILEKDHDHLLESWLKQVPEDLVSRTPSLLIIRMWILKDREAFHILPDILDQLRLMPKNIDNKLAAEIKFFEGIVQFWGGEIKKASESFRETLGGLPFDKYYGILGETKVYYMTSMQMQGRGDEVEAEIEKTLVRDNLPPYYVLKLFGALLFKNLLSGAFDKVIRIAERTRRHVKLTQGDPFIDAWVDYIMGSVYLRQNRLDKADVCFKSTIKMRYIMDLVSPVDTFAAELFVLKMQGKAELFKKMLATFRDFVQERDNPMFYLWFYSIQTRLALYDKDIKKAEKYFAKITLPEAEHSFLFWFEDPRTTYCRLLLARAGEGDLAEAHRLLCNYLQFSLDSHNVPLQVEFYILLSVSENKLGHKTAALDYLKKALVLAEIGNIRQLFIEVADDIRALLQELCGGVEVTGFSSVVLQDLQKEQQAASIRINGPILHVSEKLTNREMDVITLLEKRLTNQEIANKLSISVATVKRHTVTIYQKLNAKNRREAVIIAVREGILSL